MKLLPRFLEERGIPVGKADLYELAQECAKAGVRAKRTLTRHAKGDYSEDPRSRRTRMTATSAALRPRPSECERWQETHNGGAGQRDRDGMDRLPVLRFSGPEKRVAENSGSRLGARRSSVARSCLSVEQRA